MRYIPNSPADRRGMLAEIGVDSIEAFFVGIPENLRLRRPLDIPAAMTEPELLDYFKKIASQNGVDLCSFIGAGVYRHHVPLIIDALISRSEFFTAYTPYQAEIAQGTLQAIFEFQTYITQLTGLDVANASLYDGGTGLAEAILMAQRITRKSRILIARSVHPEYRAVVETYTTNLGVTMETIDFTANGQLDLNKLESGSRQGRRRSGDSVTEFLRHDRSDRPDCRAGASPRSTGDRQRIRSHVAGTVEASWNR